jgi:hypothetical protein
MDPIMSPAKILCHRILCDCLCWILILGLFFGCQSPVHVSKPASAPLNFEKILVLPFKDASTTGGESLDSRCPVCGRVFIPGEVAGDAAIFLTDQLVSGLKSHTNYQIVYTGLATASLTALYSANETTVAAKKTLTDRGRRHDADGVLVGFVYRYKERVGKAYGIESPASVAFDIHLIRVVDGRIIWTAHFDETQQSLGDNLFQLGSFLSRGGRWVTAEELAKSGLEKILEKFPK